MQDDLILQVRGLSKAFGGFFAVKAVDLDITEHSVHAIIGPNGAGKTTFFNLLTKVFAPTEGTISYRGEDITRERTHAIAQRGIVRSYQISAIFESLTVLQNIRIALQKKEYKDSFDFWNSKFRLKILDARVAEIAEKFQLQEVLLHRAGDLPYGRKRTLELATTSAMEPSLMLLDEPTAGMASNDIDDIINIIRELRASRTIVMVEHNLDVVSSLADTISVFNRGQVLATGSYSDITSRDDVREAYIGGSEDEIYD